jgi:sugar transferase (PEP-CTERM/EpsH1 system associated)
VKSGRDPRPLVAHVLHRLDTGGMEYVVVTLINRMPAERYRHAVIAVTEYTDYARRIQVPDVPVLALGKSSGRDYSIHGKLWRRLRELRPSVVHTLNLGAIECQAAAAAAGVPARIHGEHGRDIYDIDGSNRKYKLLRKSLRPLIHHYTAVSRDLERWLIDTIGVGKENVTQIYNGVDTDRFRPGREGRAPLPEGFVPEGGFVVGTVGRMEAVKDHPNLVRAFLGLVATSQEARARLRLVIAGDGSMRAECMEIARQAGAEGLIWMPGERTDIAEIMRAIDLFALSSIGEGIPITILEAMATGLPVVSTRVGGTCELVDEGETGALVPASDAAALGAAVAAYFRDPEMAARHGKNGRVKAEARYSVNSMVRGYMDVYDRALAREA